MLTGLPKFFMCLPNNSKRNKTLRLAEILNMSHSLVTLSEEIDWCELEREVETVHLSNQELAAYPIRLFLGLHYLKYVYEVPDDLLLLTWIENPYWQYFCGFEELQYDISLTSDLLSEWKVSMSDQLEVVLTLGVMSI